MLKVIDLQSVRAGLRTQVALGWSPVLAHHAALSL